MREGEIIKKKSGAEFGAEVRSTVEKGKVRPALPVLREVGNISQVDSIGLLLVYGVIPSDYVVYYTYCIVPKSQRISYINILDSL